MIQKTSDIDESLVYYAGQGSLAQVKDALGRGADPHYRNDEALKQAAINGRADIVRHFLTTVRGDRGNIADLQRYAATGGDLDTLKELTHESSARRLLTLARLASLNGQTHVFDYLVRRAIERIDQHCHAIGWPGNEL